MKLTHIESFNAFRERVVRRTSQALIITDSALFAIYSDFLKKTTFPVLVIPVGENMKSREGKAFIEDYLLDEGYGRDSELIAFGGGVISDLVGFVAAPFMRGISFSIIPTSVTCFVDASIGGKNGINTKHGKNLIGTFYHPVEVVNEELFLKTLSPKLYLEQTSEIVKIALTCDRELFFTMKDKIQRAIYLKKKVVHEDERDRSIRSILNFGHTFAHAYEVISKYKVSHGAAVWRGIYFASLLSYTYGVLQKSEWKLIKLKLNDYMEGMYFPPFDEKKLYQAMALDKKNKNTIPCFVLITKVGTVYEASGSYTHEIAEKVVLDTLTALKDEILCVV